MSTSPPGPEPLRLVIADDEALLRDGLGFLLDAQPDLRVVATAADGREAVTAAAEHRPDVVVMDVRMPVLDGIDATAHITARPPPRPRVLVLTTFGNDEYVYGALRAGASGFVLKRTPPAELADAIRTVARGDSLLLPDAARALIARQAAATRRWTAELATLTGRETEVLRLLARGHTNAEIAGELFLGVQTVKTHVGAILTKLSCRDRTQAVIIAYESGLALR